MSVDVETIIARAMQGSKAWPIVFEAGSAATLSAAILAALAANGLKVVEPGSDWDAIRALIGKIAIGDDAKDDPWQVAPKTGEAALQFADLLEAIGAPAPKLFMHSGEAVVFTWRAEGGEWLLTIHEGMLGAVLEPRTRRAMIEAAP